MRRSGGAGGHERIKRSAQSSLMHLANVTSVLGCITKFISHNTKSGSFQRKTRSVYWYHFNVEIIFSQKRLIMFLGSEADTVKTRNAGRTANSAQLLHNGLNSSLVLGAVYNTRCCLWRRSYVIYSSRRLARRLNFQSKRERDSSRSRARTSQSPSSKMELETSRDRGCAREKK